MPWEIFMSIKTKVFGLVVLASAMAFAGPVSHFGKLVACGANICGEKTGSTPIQLKGPSFFWSTGSPAALFSPVTVDWFVSNFDIGIIRAPMAIRYYKENSGPISVTDGNTGVTSYGYLSKDQAGATGAYKAGQKALIKLIVDQAIQDDIYVIVDWHSHNASSEVSEAANFFKEMATEYKGVPNIIWEIYNEPVSDNASKINDYAKSVVGAIRGTGNENLVIVGTNWYSSKPSEQESQGLHNTYSNIAYTLHFYTGEDGHDSYLNNKAKSNPTFVTEWGATGASGDGAIKNFSSFISWMDQNKVSGCMWFAGNDGQSSAMFPAAANTTNLDNYKNLFSGTSTTAGVFAAFMSTNKWTSFIPSSHPQGKTFKVSIAEGASKTFSSELGIVGEISSATTNSGTVTHTANSISFQSLEYGSAENVYILYSVTKNGVTINEKIFVNMTDRKPILKDTTVSVSYKATSAILLAKNLGAVNTVSKVAKDMSVTAATVSSGSVTFSNDTIYYTPTGQTGPVTLDYTAKNANGESRGTATLICENQAPTIYVKTKIGNRENTSPVYIGINNVSAKDKDGDELTFKVAYLDPQYPGSVSFNEKKDTLIYTPNGSTTGDVTILVVVTDGVADTKVASEIITLTGNGTPINVVAPTTIPADIYTPPASITRKQLASTALGIRVHRGEINLSVPISGRVVVDIFNLQGHRVANVVNESLVAGEHSISWSDSAIPAGAYIVRMRQGSVEKTLRFVKR